MTTEVVVINKVAVALAADSVVTVTSDTFPYSKTYDTANKLFALSKFHPVGMMVYGNAEFMGFPWEVIVKSYRARLKKSSFPTLEGYAKDLQIYLSKKLCKYTREDFKQNIKRIVFAELSSLLNQDNLRAASESLIQRLEQLDDFWKVKKSVYGETIEKAISLAVRNSVQDIDEDTQELLCKASFLILQKHYCSFQSSGIVLAGFGSNELFPSYIDVQMDGVLEHKLKCKENYLHKVNRFGVACLQAFAQGDMVYRFMEGVDKRYQGHVESQIYGLAKREVDRLLDELWLGSEVEKIEKRKVIQERLNGQFKKLLTTLAIYRHKEFTGPIIGMLESLPKDELANLAESLVKLTSLKRRVSEDVETVGGPIDVAVISRGDGFVWIDRKHYFKAELNPAFIQNYQHI